MSDSLVRLSDGTLDVNAARRVIELSLERGVALDVAFDLAAKWKHGWIPLNAEAVARLKRGPGYKPGKGGAKIGKAAPKGRHDRAGHLKESVSRGSVRSKGPVGRRPAEAKTPSTFEHMVRGEAMSREAGRKSLAARAMDGDGLTHHGDRIAAHRAAAAAHQSVADHLAAGPSHLADAKPARETQAKHHTEVADRLQKEMDAMKPGMGHAETLARANNGSASAMTRLAKGGPHPEVERHGDYLVHPANEHGMHVISKGPHVVSAHKSHEDAVARAKSLSVPEKVPAPASSDAARSWGTDHLARAAAGGSPVAKAEIERRKTPAGKAEDTDRVSKDLKRAADNARTYLAPSHPLRKLAEAKLADHVAKSKSIAPADLRRSPAVDAERIAGGKVRLTHHGRTADMNESHAASLHNQGHTIVGVHNGLVSTRSDYSTRHVYDPTTGREAVPHHIADAAPAAKLKVVRDGDSIRVSHDNGTNVASVQVPYNKSLSGLENDAAARKAFMRDPARASRVSTPAASAAPIHGRALPAGKNVDAHELDNGKGELRTRDGAIVGPEFKSKRAAAIAATKHNATVNGDRKAAGNYVESGNAPSSKRAEFDKAAVARGADAGAIARIRESSDGNAKKHGLSYSRGDEVHLTSLSGDHAGTATVHAVSESGMIHYVPKGEQGPPKIAYKTQVHGSKAEADVASKSQSANMDALTKRQDAEKAALPQTHPVGARVSTRDGSGVIDGHAKDLTAHVWVKLDGGGRVKAPSYEAHVTKTGPGSGHIDTEAVARGHVGESDPAALAAKLTGVQLERLSQQNTMEGRAAKAELESRRPGGNLDHLDSDTLKDISASRASTQEWRDAAEAELTRRDQVRRSAPAAGGSKAADARNVGDSVHVGTDLHYHGKGTVESVHPDGTAVVKLANGKRGKVGLDQLHSTKADAVAQQKPRDAGGLAAFGGTRAPVTGGTNEQKIARGVQMHGSDRSKWSVVNLKSAAKLGDLNAKAELDRRGKTITSRDVARIRTSAERPPKVKRIT